MTTPAMLLRWVIGVVLVLGILALAHIHVTLTYTPNGDFLPISVEK